MCRRGYVNEKIAALEQACRNAGLPFTAQRRVIMEVLAGRIDHPTADEIYESASRRLPGVSRTTVYRVLDTLVRLKVAIRISSPSASTRYDADTDRHHHAICQRCEAVTDLRAPGFDDIPLPEERTPGFSCTGYTVNFTGICPACHPETPDQGN